jgi:hypothetical protein
MQTETLKTKTTLSASELRLGNWIKTPNGKPMCVKNILENSVNQKIDGDGVIGSYQLGNFEPIPLSPDILEKCGWGKSDEHEMGMNTLTKKNDGLYFDYHFKRFRMDFGEDDRIMMPHIKYLHQLQNLYFALTGEELTINL